jgi:hypothetical protein
MRLTEETAKEIYMLFNNMCGDIENCDCCPCWSHKLSQCRLNRGAIRDALDYILACQEPTNEEKFKETFGFPLYELHQLSAEEEREWSEKIYKKNDTQMD